MKQLKTITILIFAILFACNPKNEKQSKEDIVRTYFKGLNESDYKITTSCISDSMVRSEGDFILTRNSKEYYIHFQWDSVFSPEYKLIDLQETTDSTMEVTLSKFCKRIEFLHDSATVYKSKFNIKDQRIIKVENFELVYFDTLKWSSRRDTLVAWINRNHPRLNGFIYDQTKAGAKHYLEAIELYRNN